MDFSHCTVRRYQIFLCFLDMGVMSSETRRSQGIFVCFNDYNKVPNLTLFYQRVITQYNRVLAYHSQQCTRDN